MYTCSSVPSLVPCLKVELPTTEVPSWDRNRAGALEYIDSIKWLASVSGQVPAQLAKLMHVRFKAGNPIALWWFLLDTPTQLKCQSDYLTFLRPIMMHWFGEAWAKEVRDQYDTQSFRQTGHQSESPSDFVLQCMVLGRVLNCLGNRNGLLEVHSVINQAPMDLWTILHQQTGRLWCSGLVLLFWLEKICWFKCEFMIKGTLWATSGLRQSGPLAVWSSCQSGLVLLALVWLWFGLVARPTRAFRFS
jgi:hypothetical protein